MSLITAATRFVERAPLPDALSKLGVAALVDRTSRSLLRERRRVKANSSATWISFQSRCMFRPPTSSIMNCPRTSSRSRLGRRGNIPAASTRPAKRRSLRRRSSPLKQPSSDADLEDGQQILELGCGWGSLSLFMAERFPAARITAVSNSASQRALYRSRRAAERRSCTTCTSSPPT